tara:strand:+ start:1962 stop:2213 length:252 start_codon:yes stop_codon:yes gene_type:complete
MPDAKCDKCGEKLETICKSGIELANFASLVDKRATKINLGITTQIVSISPGITHNEVDTNSNCDGVLWYEALSPTPPNIKWGT